MVILILVVQNSDMVGAEMFDVRLFNVGRKDQMRDFIRNKQCGRRVDNTFKEIT